MRIPLKWTYDSVFTITSGVGTQYYLLGNSIVDPGGSMASTQPYGYDILLQVYNNYRVYASAIQCEAMLGPSGSTTQANLPYQMIVWPNNATTSYVSDYQSALQQPYSKNVMLSNNTAQTTQKILKSYMSTMKILGAPSVAILTDDLYSAAIASSPSRTWQWSIMINSISGTPDQSIIVRIALIQYTELYRLNAFAST